MKISISPIKNDDDYCLMDEENLSIRCWFCGKEKMINEFRSDMEMQKFSIKKAVNFSNWKYRDDFARKRVLVFCTEECVSLSVSKDGTYRRMIGVR
jgi:hypothetical protein